MAQHDLCLSRSSAAGDSSVAECSRQLETANYSTDLLIATGVASAYAISVWNVIYSVPAVYFEVGAMVLLAVTLGRWFEASGKHKATEALDQLAALLPATAEKLSLPGLKSIPSR